MVRALKIFLFLTLASCIVPTSALAQGKTSQGDMAVTGNIGFANAIDNDYEGLEPFFNGTFEYYFMEEMSVRGMLGFTSFDHELGGDADISMFAANVVYYWDTGAVQPFITGGIGFYDVDLSFDRFGQSDVEFALDAGGGLDIPLQDNFAIKVEGLFHGVSGDGPDTLFSLTGGLKWRF